MDPVTAISLVANVLQFVDLGYKVCATAKEIRRSPSGLTADDERASDILAGLKRLSGNLEIVGKAPSNDDEKALFKLASNCHALSNDLSELMEKISAKNPRSCIHSICSAVRKIKYAQHRAELERRLDDCRSHLHMHLNYVASEKTKSQLISLATKADSQSSDIQSISLNLEKIQAKLCGLSSAYPDLSKGIHDITQLPQAVREALAHQRILRSIDHSDFRSRYESIDKAHEATFRWVIEDGSDEKAGRLSESRKLLRDWLAHEEGVFHILGKLGSGKSTLMKFLFKHPNTVSDLEKWAGARKLVFVSFFFWRPGSIWQNSIKGLLRGLVHETLEKCPELTPVAFPSIWEKNFALPGNDLGLDTKRHIDDESIQDAFENLLSCADVQQTHRFCFFIDALDEQSDASPNNDHKLLVENIQKWADSSSRMLKVCVSSREENVFTNAFNSTRRLRLQDLTRQDFDAYVQARLPDISDAKARQRIAETIVERANGIFLWVVLVVKALRQAFEDGRGMDDFEADLDALPSEMESVFEYLLETIPKSRKRNAHCLFRLMVYSMQLPLPSILFLDKYLKNPRFAMGDSAQMECGKISNSNQCTSEQRSLMRARKMLRGDCRGLVEATRSDRIIVTHRSAHEFLERKFHREARDIGISGFDAWEALSQMAIVQFRASDTRGVIKWLGYILGPILDEYDWAKKRDMNPGDESLVALFLELERRRLLPPSLYDLGYHDQSLEYSGPPLQMTWVCPQELDGPKSFVPVTKSYLLFTRFGYLSPIESKLKQNPCLLSHAGNRWILLRCLLQGLFLGHNRYLECVKVLGEFDQQFSDLCRKIIESGPMDCLLRVISELVFAMCAWRSSTYDEAFLSATTCSGNFLATLLGKVEVRDPTKMTVQAQVLKEGHHQSVVFRMAWGDETYSMEYFWARKYGDEEFMGSIINGPIPLKELIEQLGLENEEEILDTIAEIEGEPRSKTGDMLITQASGNGILPAERA